MKTKFLVPVAIALNVLVACNEGGSGESADSAQPAATSPQWPEGAPRYSSLAELPAPWNEADLAAGETVWQNCIKCHAVDPAMPSTLGPHLHGVFARAPGSLEGRDYSPAMTEFAETTDMTYWIPEEIDEWLANPRSYLPQSAMFFDGLADETQRRDLIGWLMIESSK